MQLTLQTDYALRTLLYLAMADGSPVPVRRIAESYQISESHLVKVVQRLVGLGYVRSQAGRGGGVCLAMLPSEIGVGKVVREIEPTLAPLGCLEEDASSQDQCVIIRACALRGALRRAMDEFLGVLDGYTIADCVGTPVRSQLLLHIQPAV